MDPSHPFQNQYFPHPNSIPPQHLTQYPPTPNLTTTLTTLNDLINLTKTTLTTLSNKNTLPNHNTSLTPCPHNPNHLIPPVSLFHHTLTCPTPLNISPIINSLNYPHTLHSHKTNHFVNNLTNINDNLCFSLDGHADFCSNFYYKDCPGIVSLVSNQDSSNKVFTLPRVLFLECENFVGSDMGFIRRVLASELLFVGDELDRWNCVPCSYSFCILKCILSADLVKESDLRKWVVVNSPRYGVVIDLEMSDHVFLLFRLCWRAAVREARGLLEEKEGNGEVDLRSTSFKCPVVSEVLEWLGLQFSVLYGQANGRLFAIEMFKHCVWSAGLSSLWLPLVEKAVESHDQKVGLKELENGVGNVKDVESINIVERGAENETSVSDNNLIIFVSQVAAAVASLHERSLLEEIIRGLRHPQPRTKHHIMAEHAYLTKKADEERQKRKNYRPIVEHDGLLWQQSRSQETNKTKTREELLAEERDYKRRRMSYRGKKLKRTKIQVTRDIINEYMEEIKQAGGIGCLVKGTENKHMLSSEPCIAHDSYSDANEVQRSICNSSGANRGHPEGYYNQSHSSDNVRSRNFKNYKQQKQDICEYDEQLNEHARSINKNKHESEYRSPGRGISYGASTEQTSHRRKRDVAELSRTKHHDGGGVFPDVSSVHDSRSYSGSDSTMMKDYQMLRSKERRQKSTDKYHRSNSRLRYGFDDRYDPSESHDIENDST